MRQRQVASSGHESGRPICELVRELAQPQGCWTCRGVATRGGGGGRGCLPLPRPHVSLPAHTHPQGVPKGPSQQAPPPPREVGRLTQPAFHPDPLSLEAATLNSHSMKEPLEPINLKLKVGALFWGEIFKGDFYPQRGGRPSRFKCGPVPESLDACWVRTPFSSGCASAPETSGNARRHFWFSQQHVLLAFGG